MQKPRSLLLGAAVPPSGGDSTHLHVPLHHLVTHGVVLGMTGSGKSGLLMVMTEEALRSGVPVIMIDVKGDLPHLLLAFPSFEARAFAPWVEGHGAPDELPPPDLAQQLAEERRRQLGAWSIGLPELESFAGSTSVRVLTPGSTAGEPLHILSSLEHRSASWDADPEASRAAISAAISLAAASTCCSRCSPSVACSKATRQSSAPSSTKSWSHRSSASAPSPSTTSSA